MMFPKMFIRVFLFTLCICMRLAIAYMYYFLPQYSDRMQKVLLFSSVFITFSFLYAIYYPRETGVETLGDVIWWSDYRMLHFVNWFIASLTLMSGRHEMSGFLIALDALIGLSLFIEFRFM